MSPATLLSPRDVAFARAVAYRPISCDAATSAILMWFENAENIGW